jgi:hypothetical protein
MKNWKKLTSVASIILAVAAIIVAVNAMRLTHQSNLPIISAISTIRYDDTEGWWSDELVVNNDGFPLREFDCHATVVVSISVVLGERTYIPIYGYFGIVDNYTGNSKGLLVSMSEKGNYSLYMSIDQDFWREAYEDGYSAFLSPYRILLVSYEDYSRGSWREYYLVSTSGSHEISEDYARTILDSASANKELMENEGLNCYMSALNGTGLWHWYKGQYLG